MEEREAIARLQRGDITGLEALVRRYQQPALEAAFLVTHNYALAEDIVQSAFLRAYERIGQYDTTRPFAPWFLRSVVNSALTAVTGQRAVSWEACFSGDDADIPSPDPGLDALLEAAETREAILAALHKLSPAQRAAVVMRYYFDWSDAEVAQRLRVPPGTVRRRLHDARQRLRRLLPTEPGG